MARLAILKPYDATHDRVANVVLGDPSDYPDLLDVTGERVSPGDLRDKATGEFSTPVDQTPTLAITLGAEVETAGNPVSWTAAVRDGDGNLVPISGEYDVPVVRGDGFHAALVTVALVDGQASGSISITTPGIYHLDMGAIYPAPQSKLAKSPVLRVRG